MLVYDVETADYHPASGLNADIVKANGAKKDEPVVARLAIKRIG